MASTHSSIRNQTIFTADNIDILRGMDDESIDLIYLDPPFNSNRNYQAPIGSEAAGAQFKDAWTFEDTKEAWWGLIADEHPAIYKVIDAAGDVGGKGDKAYLIYMAMRLLEMKRILKKTGSIYLHCDPTMSHSLKMVMDGMFGKKNFINEIIWCYDTAGRSKKYWNKKHDVILLYSKSKSYTFNETRTERQNKVEDWESWYPLKDEDGRRYQIDGKGYKYYMDAGRLANDWWNDIRALHANRDKERVGYPTQKPLALLKRIIKASSNENDTILDPFCGCATACLAAEDLKRKWIGIDISPIAATLIQRRMEDELGLFSKIIHRTDFPIRSTHLTKPSKNINHTLFGQQEGKCNGCKHSFPFQNFTRDHITPKAKGGQDTDANLQLLCGRCNSIKGDRTMEYLLVQLKADNTMNKT